MDNVEGGVVSSDARQARLLPESHNAVGRACQAVATTLDTFSSFPTGAEPNVELEIESTALQLDMMLSVLRQASCDELADMREKCRVFRRVEELLPWSDPRLQLFARDLLHQMAELLEDPQIV